MTGDIPAATFCGNAVRLYGQIALLIGWRPDEFWQATPSEIAHILTAMTPQTGLPPSHDTINKLKEAFPDG